MSETNVGNMSETNVGNIIGSSNSRTNVFRKKMYLCKLNAIKYNGTERTTVYRLGTEV